MHIFEHYHKAAFKCSIIQHFEHMCIRTLDAHDSSIIFSNLIVICAFKTFEHILSRNGSRFDFRIFFFFFKLGAFDCHIQNILGIIIGHSNVCICIYTTTTYDFHKYCLCRQQYVIHFKLLLL